MDKLTGVRLQERSRKDPVVSAPLVGQENTCSRLDHSGGGSAAVEVFTAPGSVNLNLPDITVTPLSLDFGSIPINNLAAQLVTVKNDGVLDLTIGGVTFGGVNINQFSKSTDKCSKKTLAPGASCTVDLRFKPTTTGLKTAIFIIPSNDPDENPFSVSLSGIGVNKK